MLRAVGMLGSTANDRHDKSARTFVKAHGLWQARLHFEVVS